MHCRRRLFHCVDCREWQHKSIPALISYIPFIFICLYPRCIAYSSLRVNVDIIQISYALFVLINASRFTRKDAISKINIFPIANYWMAIQYGYIRPWKPAVQRMTISALNYPRSMHWMTLELKCDFWSEILFSCKTVNIESFATSLISKYN